ISLSLLLLHEMARGSSQSQTTSTASNSRPGVMAPRGPAATTAGMRRRRIVSSSSGSTGGSLNSGGGASNMLRFYTDDAPGLKISPTVVLIMSLCFIGFVTALHVFGKFYRKSGAAA
ncbi:Sec61_beta domain-containing protein, partial [Cephalotus follicularis]